MHRTTARASLDTFSILIAPLAPPPLIQDKAHPANDKPICKDISTQRHGMDRPELARLLPNAFIRERIRDITHDIFLLEMNALLYQ